MTPRSPQDTPAPGWLRPAPAAVVALVLSASVGCEAPARVKPWRHAPDPVGAAATAPSVSPVAGGGTGSAILAARPHTLRVAISAEPKGLNPLLDASLWTRRIMVGTVFEPLLRHEPDPARPDGPGRYAPRLARSWKISGNGLDLLLELEPGATWHDGRAVTSVDAQFTLDLVRSPSGPAPHYRALLSDIEVVELVGPRALRIRMYRPNVWMLRALAELPMIPAHVYERGLAAGGALVGSGPYRYVGWKDGVVRLTAHAKHHRGAPAIRDLELVYDSDAAIILTAAKRGEIDIVPELIPAHWPEQASAPGFASTFTALELKPPRLRALLFDAGAPPLDDARVRRALSLLIDRRGLAKDVYDGLAEPVASVAWPGGPLDAPALPVPAFDPQAAGLLLDQAGWTDSDGDGVRDQAGKPMRLDVLVVEREHGGDRPGRVPERDRLLDAFKRVGIGLDVRVGSEAVIDNRLVSGEFDLAFVELGGMVDMDLAPWFATGGRLNASRLVSRRIDRALEALGAAWDPAQRRLVAGELAAAIDEAMPLAAIVAEAPQGLVHQRVQGVVVWDGWIDLTRLSLAPP